MSSFKNVTDVDLEVQVDGRRYSAEPGEEITIPDQFDAQLANQPAWGGEEFAPDALPVEPEPEAPKKSKTDKSEPNSAATEEKK